MSHRPITHADITAAVRAAEEAFESLNSSDLPRSWIVHLDPRCERNQLQFIAHFLIERLAIPPLNAPQQVKFLRSVKAQLGRYYADAAPMPLIKIDDVLEVLKAAVGPLDIESIAVAIAEKYSGRSSAKLESIVIKLIKNKPGLISTSTITQSNHVFDHPRSATAARILAHLLVRRIIDTGEKSGDGRPPGTRPNEVITVYSLAKRDAMSS